MIFFDSILLAQQFKWSAGRFKRITFIPSFMDLEVCQYYGWKLWGVSWKMLQEKGSMIKKAKNLFISEITEY